MNKLTSEQEDYLLEEVRERDFENKYGENETRNISQAKSSSERYN